MNTVRETRTAPDVDGSPIPRTPLPIVGWRIVIAGLAWWGLLAALHGDITGLRYFSQVTTLTVALTATASVLTFRVTSPGWARVLGWCRGACTTYAVVTALIYQVCSAATWTRHPACWNMPWCRRWLSSTGWCSVPHRPGQTSGSGGGRR